MQNLFLELTFSAKIILDAVKKKDSTGQYLLMKYHLMIGGMQ
jgi:hypothetical protein